MDLKGKVVDKSNNPVGGAAVIISKSPAGVRDVAVLTDQTGQFVLSDLHQGEYELFANTMSGETGVVSLRIVENTNCYVEIVTNSQANDEKRLN